MSNPITHAANVVSYGGIIAYPTEAVYGLGCDPFNEAAVLRILHLKGRLLEKGLILIASSWTQVNHLIIPPDALPAIRANEPTTWIFPATSIVPPWIQGMHASIAIRITQHPIAHALCEAIGGPLVSTSANISGQPAIREYATLVDLFETQIDYIVPGDLGNATRPSQIRDAMTGDIIRA